MGREKNKPVENLNSKLITEFQQGDTIYIRRPLGSGFYADLLCEFIEFRCGVVKGRVIASLELTYGKYPKGSTVSGVLKKCYLWGAPIERTQPRCHWFTTKDQPAR